MLKRLNVFLADSEVCTNTSQEYERWLSNETLIKEYEISVLDKESKEVPYDDGDDYDYDY